MPVVSSRRIAIFFAEISSRTSFDGHSVVGFDSFHPAGTFSKLRASPQAMWIQTEFSLRPRSRGFHLVTAEVVTQLPDLPRFSTGLLHLFIQHTSASLTINENADPDVRIDMETYFNRIVPESGLPLRHTCEGPDDMPAHVKSSLLGPSLLLPIRAGKLALGTWQGIYLCEHRNSGGPRRIVATIQGVTD